MAKKQKKRIPPIIEYNRKKVKRSRFSLKFSTSTASPISLSLSVSVLYLYSQPPTEPCLPPSLPLSYPAFRLPFPSLCTTLFRLGLVSLKCVAGFVDMMIRPIVPTPTPTPSHLSSIPSTVIRHDHDNSIVCPILLSHLIPYPHPNPSPPNP